MKVVKWILIALVVAVVIVLTLPVGGFSDCEHAYATLSCNVKECTKCGNVVDPNRHNWERIGCTQKYCTVCGKTGTANHYYEYVDCTTKRVCRVCGKVEYSHYLHHPDTYRVEYVDCSYEVHCTKCNVLLHDGISHNWSTYDKHQGSYCLDCGIAAPANIEHNLGFSLFGFIGICKDCGHVAFQMPNALGICAFIGLLMSIAAFIFVFINRKRIRIREGKYLWTVTPDAHLRPIRTDEEHL